MNVILLIGLLCFVAFLLSSLRKKTEVHIVEKTNYGELVVRVGFLAVLLILVLSSFAPIIQECQFYSWDDRCMDDLWNHFANQAGETQKF